MPKLKFNVQSVIFDMDGVITNTMPDHFRCWKSVMRDEGIHVSHEDVYKREGQPGINSVREIFTEHNKKFSRESALKILGKKEKMFKRIVKTRYIAGARSFLKFLHRNQITLGLVTGTSRHELHRILPKSLRSIFSVIITGSDVKHGKPHPEPYLKSLSKLNIKPGDAVVIENAPFGIRSAKQAGLKCLALETSLARSYLKEADAVFKTVRELQSKVQFNNLS